MFWELRVRRMVLEWFEVRARLDRIEAIVGRLASDLLAYDPANCPVGRLRVGTVSPSARAKTLASHLEALGSQMTPLLEVLNDLRNANHVDVLPEVLEGAAVRADLNAMSAKIGDVSGAAAEYLAREGQQACGSRVAALSEVIANRHTTKLHAGDEVREDFNCLPERIEFRADSEPLVSINISVAQSDFKRVLLALQSLLDVVESGSRCGACGHGCHSSSSVRCGCRTRSCGVVGTSHLTGEESPVGGDFEEEL